MKSAFPIGALITVIGMLLTGAVGYGTLRADVATKASSERVAVVETQVAGIRDDLAEIKATQKEILQELRAR